MDMSAVGRKSEPITAAYTEKDAILYALGVGAQADELSLVYEHAPNGFQVLPSFATLSPLSVEDVLGEEVDPPRLIHGEQCITMHRPFPPRGKVTVVGEVMDIFDKVKGAVIHVRSEATLEDGAPVFESESTLFYLGAGNFGGPGGPKTAPLLPPEGQAPDFSVAYAIPAPQAALYRLNGDMNPLHIDPEVAKRVGFDKPILHGLCTYGYATRAVISGVCGGDVTRLGTFKARFGNPVFPGDTLVTEGWRDGDNRYIIQARTENVVVLTNAYAEVT